jgi:hypothetical protein
VGWASCTPRTGGSVAVEASQGSSRRPPNSSTSPASTRSACSTSVSRRTRR